MMFMSEIDMHCEHNAPQSRSWNYFYTEKSTMKSSAEPSKKVRTAWLWSLPALLVCGSVALICTYQPQAHSTQAGPAPDPHIYQVVIEGKRMTASEKLNYDLSPDQVARVEITGHR